MNRCSYPTPEPDDDLASLVESEYAEWLAVHTGLPEYQVYSDPDVTWLIQPGLVWRNCAAKIRLTSETADERLDHLVESFRETKRGAGFWISLFATPDDLSSRLKARGFRCQKHFPQMYCDLGMIPKNKPENTDIVFQFMDDPEIFKKHPHPYLGPIRSELRQFELKRLIHLQKLRPKKVRNLIALRNTIPVGACTLFINKNVVGFHDVGVLPSARRQGIGTALMQYANAFARERGAKSAVLTASGEGYGLYLKTGFREVGKVSHWYRQFKDI